VRKTLPAVAAVLLCACSRDIQNSDAVRAGVVDYLTTNQSSIGIDPNMMQIDVTSVSFEKDSARATVAFRVKSGADTGQPPIMVTYNLNRKANKWVVRGKAESGASPHGAGLPEPGGDLPPGHPPVGTKQ